MKLVIIHACEQNKTQAKLSNAIIQHIYTIIPYKKNSSFNLIVYVCVSVAVKTFLYLNTDPIPCQYLFHRTNIITYIKVK